MGQQIKITAPQFEGDRGRQAQSRYVAETIMTALNFAQRNGLVVEVTLDPDTPLAQGAYTPHVRIRETKFLGLAREKARGGK